MYERVPKVIVSELKKNLCTANIGKRHSILSVEIYFGFYQLSKLVSPKDDLVGELKMAKTDSLKKIEETEHEDQLAQALTAAGQLLQVTGGGFLLL